MSRDRAGLGRRIGHEKGAATLLVVTGMLLICVVALAAVVIAAFLTGARAARGAADLAALSAAEAFVSGQDACSVANRIADRNDARLRTCRVTGDPGRFVVAVEVERVVPISWPGLPSSVQASAQAGRGGQQ